ncbi:MAG: BON domain-containing protein [gamma proteobacterium symbiont of Taylorina sp.]|nr:BON domain-containing protein [gamma proteobacterium symbiont of Taylorina sp.]
MRTLILTSLLLITFTLSGCTAAVIGGVAAGTSVALDKRTTGDYVEDQNIKMKFTHLYYQDDLLNEKSHINVTSYNLHVLITGEVESKKQKQALSKIAENIKNIRQYYNEVVIGQPTSFTSRSNDSYLTGKIKTSVFTSMSELDGAQVKVVTENGSVFLMGLVTQKQGNQITEITRTTQGVKRVIKLFEYVDPNNMKY